ncbi:MAG TPA: restriction endonuclease subunit S [Candidatus Bathyarchaeia archaeon]|nr:restriction endonuclease subunit S [Candidatus Bathyarchaeia archaeon]
MRNETIPAGWARAELGDVVTPVRQQVTPAEQPNTYFNYLSIENVASGSGRLVNFRPTIGRDIRSAKYRFTPKDLLYSKLRPYLNKVHLPSFNGISATDLVPLRPSDGISREYIAYYLRTQAVVEYAREHVRGIQLPRLPMNDLLSLRLRIPPTKEQVRIVFKIEELFNHLEAARQALNKVPSLMQQFRRSVLAKAFRGELTERDSGNGSAVELLERVKLARRKKWEDQLGVRGSRNYSEPVGPDTTSLPVYPREWSLASLQQIAFVERGKFSFRPRNDKRFYGGKHPFIQTGDISNSSGRIRSFKQTLNDSGLAISKMFKRGTIMVAIAANIGDSAILEFDGCAPDSVVGITCVEPILPEYVEFYIRTRRSDLERFAPATAQKNINLRILNPLAIPIPPIAEQERIIRRISEGLATADLVEAQTRDTSNKLESLMESILVQAFHGELVPQDPNDEPAEGLLARLKVSSAV